MASSEITVARILELDVPVSWQECVAIAGEVTTLHAVGPALGQPHPRIDAESCVLTRRGDVRLPHPAEGPQPDADVQLLRALLAGREIPADLEQVAYGPPPAHLGDALAMFSRPDRRTDIASVAIRGLAAEAELQQAVAAPAAGTPPTSVFESIDGELSRLRAEVSGRSVPARPEDAPADEPPVAPPRPTSAWNRGVVIGGVAIAAVLAGVGVWMAMGPPVPAAPAVALPGALLPADLNDWWHAVGTRGADIDLGPARRGRSATPSPSATVPSPAERTVATPGAAGAGVTPSAPQAAPGPSSPSTDGPATVEPIAVAAEPPVYSWRSANVAPPEMVLPRMPESSFPPPDATIDGQFIEVLISEAGEVEAVRLRGTPAEAAASYRYAMILAAAKAWQFTPATRDGVPVRYVIRVVVDP